MMAGAARVMFGRSYGIAIFTLGDLFVHAFVDPGDLLAPPGAVGVLQLQHAIHRPVEVIGDIGYLLVELVERVAGYSPTASAPISTSKLCSQCGQVTGASAWPFSLIRR